MFTIAGKPIQSLSGFSSVARSGSFSGCHIEVEVYPPDLVLFAITGRPAGSENAVFWEASATDIEGVIEWFVDFGLWDQVQSWLDASR